MYLLLTLIFLLQILNCVPQLILPIKKALNTRNPSCIVATLKAIQQLVMTGKIEITSYLFPYFIDHHWVLLQFEFYFGNLLQFVRFGSCFHPYFRGFYSFPQRIFFHVRSPLFRASFYHRFKVLCHPCQRAVFHLR